MNTTSTPVFTSGNVEVERFPDVTQLILVSDPSPDALGGEVQAILKLNESEALEVGLMLIRAHHAMQEARIARGEPRTYTPAEIADAYTIVKRYLESPEV